MSGLARLARRLMPVMVLVLSVFGWLEKSDATAVIYIVTSGITMLSLGAVGYWSWRRHLIRRKKIS